MKLWPCALAIALSLGGNGCARATSAPDDLAKATVVIYNRAALDSPALARFYATQRHIPNENVIGLDCSNDEEISRQEYDDTIANPLRKIFAQHNWWVAPADENSHSGARDNRIHFVAMIRGMPLKIRATANYPGDEPGGNPLAVHNEASVDSELATLGFFSKQISGVAMNPYFQDYRPIGEIAAPILLVSRLDAPTAGVVRQMISASIDTEKNGLWGRAYVDGAHNISGGLATGDRWLQTVARDLRRVGVPVDYDDKPAIVPSGYPMNNCALYYGWYAGGISGALADPDLHFTRGAVAVHIHSFSANTLRVGTNWVAPLLDKGAAASLGNVYEPYLEMTTHLDIFNDRLLRGFTLAESAYMGTRVLSWMTIVVGDPLYRPFAVWQGNDAKKSNRSRNNWQLYHDFALKNSKLPPNEYLEAAHTAATRANNGPMIEDLGLMQAEAGDFASAVKFLRQAQTLYRKHEDGLRVALEEVDALRQANQRDDALRLVQEMEKILPEGASADLLRKIEAEINPPSPTPTR